MSTYERDPDTGNLNLIDGMRSIDDIKVLMLDLCYPIGSIYISTKNVSPQTFLGGTWKSKSNYVLRGATSGVKFDRDTNDGGADSVTVSSVASHNHSQNAHKHRIREEYGASPSGSYNPNNTYSQIAGANAGTKSWQGDPIENTTATNIADGSNYTVQTLPKYKNVYIWERTA